MFALLIFMMTFGGDVMNAEEVRQPQNMREMATRGYTILENLAPAMRTEVEDLSLVTIRETLKTIYDRYPDIAYVAAVEAETLTTWCAMDKDKSFKDMEKMERDSVMAWVETLQAPGMMIYERNGKKICEFAAPVMITRGSDEEGPGIFLRLGFVMK